MPTPTTDAPSTSLPLVVAVVSVLCVAGFVARRMPIVVINGHKGPGTASGGQVSGRRRIFRALTYLFVTALTFLILFRITGTFDIYYKVKAIAVNEDTSLRSGAGIAKFCRELQGVGQEKRFQVVLLVTGIYMLLQTFCIPGTVVLNAAVGAVLGTLVGVPYCTLLGTVGACSCFFLSKMLGTSLVEAADARLMKGRGLPNIRSQVHKYYHDLFVYMLFLRLTPILPNWLVNLASPVVGVPVKVFAGATFLGTVPQTYLSVRFGAMARNFKPKGDDDAEGDADTRIVTPWDTLLLAVIGIAILAGFRLKKKFAANDRAGDGSSDEAMGGKGFRKPLLPQGGV